MGRATSTSTDFKAPITIAMAASIISFSQLPAVPFCRAAYLSLTLFSRHNVPTSISELCDILVDSAMMRRRTRLGIARLACALEVALLLCASTATGASAACADNIDPAAPETSITEQHGTNSTSQSNILHFSDQRDFNLVARQLSCPDPSTNQFCQSGYCFLYLTDGGSSWGTCCPAGWSLWLNAPEWSSQKCCPPGISEDECGSGGDSEAPLQPIDCGSGGVISGWACVYSAQSNDGVQRATSWDVWGAVLGVWMATWIATGTL